MKKISLLLYLPIILALGSSCEDSYLMRKIKEREGNPGPAATPSPPAQPEASASPKSERAPKEDPQKNVVNQLLKKNFPPTQTPSPGEPQPENREAPKDKEALKNEIQAYMACLNRTWDRVSSSQQRYLSWVKDAKIGPNCQERYITYGIYTLYPNGIELCQKAATAGTQSGPSLPTLEKAAQSLAQSYATLVPMVQKAHDYYQQKDYLDDGCAQGKQMHSELMAEFETFLGSAQALNEGLAPLQAKLIEEQLQSLAGSGKVLPWHVVKYLQSAQKLGNFLPDSPQGPWRKDGYAQAFQQMDQDFQALEAYLQEQPEEKDSIRLFTPFMSQAKEFYVVAKLLGRDLQQSKKISASDFRKWQRQYKQLMDWANRISF